MEHTGLFQRRTCDVDWVVPEIVCLCMVAIDSATRPSVHTQSERRDNMTHDPSAGPQFRWSDSNDAPWIPSTLAKGVEVKNLGKANGRAIQLVRFLPGAVFPDHLHTGPEFIYVVEGEVTWNGRLLARGCVGVAEAGTVERGFRSMTGCVFLLMYDLDQLFDSVNSVTPGSAQ